MEDAVARFKPAVHRFWKRPAPIITRAEGVYLWDQNGKRYIDGAAGSSVVVNIGHGVQSVVDAMAVQAKQVCFAAPPVFSNPPMLDQGQCLYTPALYFLHSILFYNIRGYIIKFELMVLCVSK
jgi:adenosylmethionine-8-amino-7-oxononanoate aminotransferase